MHSIKTALLWVSLCAGLVLGACVDENVAKPDDGMKPPAPGPCGQADGKDIDPITITVFGAATGTPVLYPENKPPAVPDIFLTIPDKDGEPEVITSFSEGSLTTADLCPGKEFEVTAYLGGALEDKLGTVKTPVVDEKKPFAILTGGLIKADAATRHGINNVPFKLFTVDESAFGDEKTTQIIVVHASVLLGEPATADVGGKPAAFPTRFTATAPIDVAADPEKALPITFKAATDVKSVTIGPRYPKGAHGLAVLFDTLDNDSKAEKAGDPSSSLFLTADDPLLSALPATGVTFPVEE
jgi:hypothetical protein